MMDTNLQHEDLLIRLRAKLNEEKIKLWESPYVQGNNEISSSLQDLAQKYAEEIKIPYETILAALHELQLHSIERSKANTEFKETGLATFRVNTATGDKSSVLSVQMKLDVQGAALLAEVAKQINIPEDRVKLIVNGKVIKAALSLEEQGVKNGAQIMALLMAENPEMIRNEDTMYMEMKTTRDDAMLLSECVDDLADDDEYMKLEDQSGNPVELPVAERRALLVGLALHGRGRAAMAQKHHDLALVLFLEADRQFKSSILKTVDNWALLQLDIAWCYLCLQALGATSDAAARLQRAEEAFNATYGEDHQRLIALKGTAANERVLLMRLYLLQGIVAYHQNKRADARRLLDRAEAEINALRVDEAAVSSLVELGWSRGQAAAGLRAAAGQRDAAHLYLQARRQRRERARADSRADRQRRALGVCEDGSPVNPKLVEALVAMGYTRPMAIVALRNSNNVAADAVRLIQEQPELLLEDSESSSSSRGTSASDDSLVEPDSELVAELVSLGHEAGAARAALRRARNHLPTAAHLLDNSGNPSTSAGAVASATPKAKRHKKNRKEREAALGRLSAAIRGDEDSHLYSSLDEEEHFLAQYKSLL